MTERVYIAEEREAAEDRVEDLHNRGESYADIANGLRCDLTASEERAKELEQRGTRVTEILEESVKANIDLMHYDGKTIREWMSEHKTLTAELTAMREAPLPEMPKRYPFSNSTDCAEYSGLGVYFPEEIDPIIKTLTEQVAALQSRNEHLEKELETK